MNLRLISRFGKNHDLGNGVVFPNDEKIIIGLQKNHLFVRNQEQSKSFSS